MSIHTALTPEAEERLRKQKVTSTVTSLVIAALSMVLVGALLALLMIVMPTTTQETIISYQPPNVEETEETNEKKVQTNQRQLPTPPSASASVANVITSNSMSNVSVPDAQTMTSVESIEFGEVEDFGMDSSFEESMATETSFFGASLKGSRICYVIDYSASMSGQRDKLMRKELTESVKKLAGGAMYNLIFFSGPVWQAGDKVMLDKSRREGVVTCQEDGNTYKWEDTARQLWGPDGKKQKMIWRKPSRENIEAAMVQISDTPLVYGTRWEAPLEYAINMDPRPDIVVFMTDGSSGDDSLQIAEDMAKLARRRNVVINTVALMEPKAEEGMKLLAEETGGSATMVVSADKVVDLITGEPRE